MSQASGWDVGDLIDERPFTGQQILIVALCLLFNMVDGFDITAMAVAAHQVGEQMQIGADQLGLVFSFSLAGMMCGALFLASLSDVFGRRTMIIASLALVGATVLATAWADSLITLIILRFVSGLGAGAMLASVATLASEFTPERYRALSVTAVTAGYPLGAMMTGVVAGSVMPEYGWQGMFLGGGALTLVLAIVAYLLIPESIQFLCAKQPPGALTALNRTLTKLAAPTLDALPPLPPPGDDGAASRNVLRKMLSLLQPRFRTRTLILWAAFFLAISALYFLMSWVPKLIINAGYTEAVGNQAFTLFNFGGVLGIVGLGWLATRGNLSLLIAVFAIIASVLMWLFASLLAGGASQTTLTALIFVIGISLQGGYTGLYAVAAKIYPLEIRSTGVGWAIGLGRFGAVIGPGMAGYMIAADIPLTTTFLTFAVPLFFSGVLAYTLKVR